MSLAIVEASVVGYRIAWIVDGDIGLCLGESGAHHKPEPTDREAWEVWAADRAAAHLATGGDSGGFYWETLKGAKAALKVVKASLKQDRPLPAWAITALEHGWKAPKGWKA